MKAKHLFAFILAFGIVLSAVPCLSVGAEEIAQPSVDEASAVWFAHLETDTLVISKNENSVIPAGSTPKIMAGLLFCEALHTRTGESVSITSPMLSGTVGHRFGLSADDILTVEELLYLALCGSYNDAYDVLACVVGGTKADFVDRMNARAAELGATNTHFTDVSGVADTSTTTAADQALIAEAAISAPLYLSLAETSRYAFDGSLKLPSKTVSNRNALIGIGTNSTTLYYNELCRGLSAGSTTRGGNCVVTLADNGSERYLCIVMGASDIGEKNMGYTVANRLIDWVYDAYAYLDVISPEQVLCTIPVTVSDMTEEVAVAPKESLSVYLPRNITVGKEITYSIRLIHTTLEAPVEKGMMVGYVAILYNGENIGTLPLYTVEEAERSGFIGSLKALQNLTQNRIFLAGAGFFIVGLTAWIVTETVIRRRRRHKWDKYFSAKTVSTVDVVNATAPKRDPANKSNRRNGT